MTEFKSFIFEKKPTKNQSLIWWIIGGLFTLGLIFVVLDIITFWSAMLFFILPCLLALYIRLSAFKSGENAELNGSFTDELTMNINEIKIANNSIPIERIKSLSIIYNNVLGTKRYSAYSGTSRLNGETNVLRIELIDNKLVQYNFRLESIGHAKQLIELTDLLKDKIAVKNNWKINYNA